MNERITDNMFDLKTCFLDLLGVQVGGGGNGNAPKPKKSLKEFSNRYTSNNFMKKYNEINIIQFNENMSMQSRNATLQKKLLPGNRYPGVFQTSPLNRSFENSLMKERHPSQFHLDPRMDMDVETVCYDFSSDGGSTITTTSDDGETGINEFSDVGATGRDSFCTLCTSSFSFNNCRNCDGNSCSSKCSVDSSCYCCTDRSVER